MNNPSIQIVAAVNDDDILSSNLLKSPLIQTGTPFVAMRGYSSASVAYNAAFEKCDSDILIFAHQDVYIPKRWLERAQAAIKLIEKQDMNWAVLGVFGCNLTGSHIGRAWSSGIGREIGSSFAQPTQVQSLDELLLIIKRSSNLRFDESLPHFHHYGTDIVQIACAQGLKAYVIDAPVIHNSTRIKWLPLKYFQTYRVMQKKWRALLPLQTNITSITQFGLPLIVRQIRLGIMHMRSLIKGPKQAKFHNTSIDIEKLAEKLHY